MPDKSSHDTWEKEAYEGNNIAVLVPVLTAVCHIQ